MNSTGKKISQLRKQAGFTQKALADALCVTDKAVSKWERGLACPDISLLPKLSALLDADIENLLLGVSTITTHLWKGVLLLNGDILSDMLIFDKPMVYYLISNFMLIGIKEIIIVGNETEIVAWKKIIPATSLYGIKCVYLVLESCDSCDLNSIVRKSKSFLLHSNTFIITKKIFLFAVSLTRQLQFFTSLQDDFIQIKQQNGEDSSLLLVSGAGWDNILNKKNISDIDNYIKSKAIIKTMGRGTICVTLDNYEHISDVSTFIKFYQTYHHQKIADIKEIALNRNLMSEE